ncbi:hypothetical protein INT48_002748 [Thamnidium elegans]|uniref:FAD-binding FR-type domain-containing protein n=1 Tax=Thamnidium elegans TaxID=101142 RepID=A0A8H7SLS2_9FUNG|nr:hypothetical protein INT48_002748 [Thamnidium elegans]
MGFTVRTTSGFFVCGISYAFFWWGLFAIYCIGYQLNKVRVYYVRKQRLAGNDSKVLIDLPGSKFFNQFDHVVRVPFITEMIPLKHVIGITVFILINAVFIIFAPFALNPGMGFVINAITTMDRRAAFVGMVNWGFVFFLAQRNSILTRMSGLTVEELLPFHRIIARIGLAEFIPHYVWRIWRGYEKNMIVKDALFLDQEQTSGAIAMFGFLIMFATSLEYIRRNYFEIFYYCHVIFMLVGVCFACWHEPTCFAFFIPALILWFADRVIRSYSSWCLKTTSARVDQVVSNTSTQEGIVRVLFSNKNMNTFKPGQYVFVSIARTGRKLWKYANWHPYTISEVFRVNNHTDSYIDERMIDSATNTIKDGKTERIENVSPDSFLDIDSLSDTNSLRRRANPLPSDKSVTTVGTFHIKALGNKTRDLVKRSAANEQLRVIVDGPYGPCLDYQDFQVLALFSTGIGITPSLAIIKDVLQRRCNGVRTVAVEHIYLTWAIKSTVEIPPFMDMFVYWTELVKNSTQSIYFTANIYVTREHEGPNIFEDLVGFNVIYGQRPKVNIEMDKIKTVNANRRVWAHACGSALFTKTVINEAVCRHFHVHNETFEF